jgi:hypothetical protein
MNHESTETITLEVRYFTDSESPTGDCFIVDIMNSNGECLVEGAGTANRRDVALLEAMNRWVSE